MLSVTYAPFTPLDRHLTLVFLLLVWPVSRNTQTHADILGDWSTISLDHWSRRQETGSLSWGRVCPHHPPSGSTSRSQGEACFHSLLVSEAWELAPCARLSQFPQQPCWVGSVTLPSLQKWKQRQRKFRWFDQLTQMRSRFRSTQPSAMPVSLT